MTGSIQCGKPWVLYAVAAPMTIMQSTFPALLFGILACATAAYLASIFTDSARTFDAHRRLVMWILILTAATLMLITGISWSVMFLRRE